jgi:hypothetical protein
MLIAWPKQLLHQKVKTSATSLNDGKFAHPFIFGVFVGQFCGMIVKKMAILSLLI